MDTEPTEKAVLERSVTDEISVRALIGYGRSVSLDIEPSANVYFSMHLEPHQARDLAAALMDAAAEADR